MNKKSKRICGAAAALLAFVSLLFCGVYLRAHTEYEPPGATRTPKTARERVALSGTGYTMSAARLTTLQKADPLSRKKTVKTAKSKTKKTKSPPSAKKSTYKTKSSAAISRTKGTPAAGGSTKAAGSGKNGSGNASRANNGGGSNDNSKSAARTRDKGSGSADSNKSDSGGSGRNSGGSDASGSGRSGGKSSKKDNSASGKSSKSRKNSSGSRSSGENDDPSEEDTPDDENPVVTTDLVNGQKVSGTSLVFSLSARDYYGERISAASIVVTLNGTRITSDGDSTDGTISYSIDDQLKDGKNTITIEVTDDEGNQRVITRTVNCDASAEPEITGSVYVSIEAKTVSLGTLCNRYKVPIKQTYKVRDVIKACLTAKGFTCQFNDGETYLISISKPGFAKNAKIAPKLLAAAKKAGWLSNEETVGGRKSEDPDSTLGQRDFYPQSGWVFSVDKQFAKTGVSAVRVKDKQEIRLYFTVFGYGADVDGQIKW